MPDPTCLTPLAAWQCGTNDNWTTADPGFVDAARGDFRLRPDAEAFRRLPGFEPVPFEKMGLYADSLRPVVDAEPWPAPPPALAAPPGN
jgi:hypothetical protein